MKAGQFIRDMSHDGNASENTYHRHYVGWALQEGDNAPVVLDAYIVSTVFIPGYGGHVGHAETMVFAADKLGDGHVADWSELFVETHGYPDIQHENGLAFVAERLQERFS